VEIASYKCKIIVQLLQTRRRSSLLFLLLALLSVTHLLVVSSTTPVTLLPYLLSYPSSFLSLSLTHTHTHTHTHFFLSPSLSMSFLLTACEKPHALSSMCVCVCVCAHADAYTRPRKPSDCAYTNWTDHTHRHARQAHMWRAHAHLSPTWLSGWWGGTRQIAPL